jgi:hypothetical protein
MQENFKFVGKCNSSIDRATPAQQSSPDLILENQDLKKRSLPMDQYVDFDSDDSSIFSNLEIEAAKKSLRD